MYSNLSYQNRKKTTISTRSKWIQIPLLAQSLPPSLHPKHPKNITFLARYGFQFQKKYRSKRKSDLTCGFALDDIRESSSARATPHCRANASSFGKRSVDLEVMVFHKSRAGREGREWIAISHRISIGFNVSRPANWWALVSVCNADGEKITKSGLNINAATAHRPAWTTRINRPWGSLFIEPATGKIQQRAPSPGNLGNTRWTNDSLAMPVVIAFVIRNIETNLSCSLSDAMSGRIFGFSRCLLGVLLPTVLPVNEELLRSTEN